MENCSAARQNGETELLNGFVIQVRQFKHVVLFLLFQLLDHAPINVAETQVRKILLGVQEGCLEVDREHLVVHVENLVGMLGLGQKTCGFIVLSLPNEPLSNFARLKRPSIVVIVSDPFLLVVVVLHYIEVLLPEIHTNIH